jgi:hypothetical protein
MVADHLRLPASAADDDQLIAAVDAVNAWVAALPWVTRLPDPDVWPADVSYGATMLAARYWRRRNSPAGVDAATDAVVYVPRRDSDLDMFLRTGPHTPARVG